MNLKVIYHNFRVGQVAIYGVLTMINFVIISHTLTVVKYIIPLSVWVPLVMLGVILTSIIVGKQFKKIQLGTDSNEVFRHSPELMKTLRLILEGQEKTVQKEKWINQLKEYEAN
jgi:hypothetical protein